MHRDNWNGVFENQDRILKQLKPLENEMFLAGGTGLQRFVLPQAYRHSEDLYFFFTNLKNKEEIDNIKNKILELMSEIPNAELENIKWIKDEKSYRMFYSFKDNEEIIKIELQNFTCCRLHDTSFTNSDIFRTENL